MYNVNKRKHMFKTRENNTNNTNKVNVLLNIGENLYNS